MLLLIIDIWSGLQYPDWISIYFYLYIYSVILRITYIHKILNFEEAFMCKIFINYDIDYWTELV